MKKSIIALAVAGALAAPMAAQADATLYGSLRVKLQTFDELNIVDNTSRIGVKGSTDLFSGNKAIFQFEQGVSTDTGAWAGGRIARIGATGDFGAVSIGHQWTPFALWTVLPLDVADNSASGKIAGYATALGSLHRLPAAAYISPNMGGFQAAVAVLADDNNDGEDVDAVNVAAKFSTGGLFVGASYVDHNVADADHLSVAATYTMDAIKVGARFGTGENGSNEPDQFSLFGQYTMGNTKLIAGFADDDAQSDDAMYVEVQQKLGKQARVFASYTDTGAATDGDGIEVGYRVDF